MGNYITRQEPNLMQLSVFATEELIVNLRRNDSSLPAVSLRGGCVFPLLEGSRVSFWGMPRSIDMSWATLRMFYESLEAADLWFAGGGGVIAGRGCQRTQNPIHKFSRNNKEDKVLCPGPV